jgi:hypothetical protein
MLAGGVMLVGALWLLVSTAELLMNPDFWRRR